MTKQRRPQDRTSGHCVICGYHKGDKWSIRASHSTLKRMGVSSARRVRRNQVEW